MLNELQRVAENSNYLPGDGELEENDRKRERSDDAVDIPPSKRTDRSGDVLFRIVVPSKQIGRVIGKNGVRIQKIREETKATIKIADAVARYEERVIIISSRDNEDQISSAESALYCIACLILKEDNEVVLDNVGGHHPANVVKLLIAGSQAGCLIGVSGQKIEEIRKFSGATIVILPPNQLPSCASAHESDRIVQVSGKVAEILKALEKIGHMLRENPTRKVISIRQTYNMAFVHSTPSYILPYTADQVASEMMIDEALVGGLIGKQGSNISRIRFESGATIKVVGEKGEATHRRILISGNAQQVAVARMLVENCVHSQLT